MRQFLLLLCLFLVFSCTDKPVGGPGKKPLLKSQKRIDSLSIDDFEGVWINNTFYKNLKKNNVPEINCDSYEYCRFNRQYTPYKIYQYLSSNSDLLIAFALKKTDKNCFIRECFNWKYSSFESKFIPDSNIASTYKKIHGEKGWGEEFTLIDSCTLMRKENFYTSDTRELYHEDRELYIKLSQQDTCLNDIATKLINSMFISGIYKDRSGKQIIITDEGKFISQNEQFKFEISLEFWNSDNDYLNVFDDSLGYYRYNELIYEWKGKNLLIYRTKFIAGDCHCLDRFIKHSKPLYDLKFQGPYINYSLSGGLDALRGCWLSKKYLDELKKTKSPYKASHADGGINMLFIGQKNDSVYHRMLSGGFHDGAWDYFKGLKFIRFPEIYQFIYTKPDFSGKSTEPDDIIRISKYNEVIWAYGKSPDYDANGTFERISYENKDYNKAIEEFARKTVIEGPYTDQAGNDYFFSLDGGFTGPGFSKKYTVGLDHVEIGFDYITLNPNQEGFKRLEFKWKGNKLYLYEVQTKKDEWPQKNYNKKPLYVLEKNEKFF